MAPKSLERFSIFLILVVCLANSVLSIRIAPATTPSSTITDEEIDTEVPVVSPSSEWIDEWDNNPDKKSEYRALNPYTPDQYIINEQALEQGR